MRYGDLVNHHLAGPTLFVKNVTAQAHVHVYQIISETRILDVAQSVP